MNPPTFIQSAFSVSYLMPDLKFSHVIFELDIFQCVHVYFVVFIICFAQASVKKILLLLFAKNESGILWILTVADLVITCRL